MLKEKAVASSEEASRLKAELEMLKTRMRLFVSQAGTLCERVRALEGSVGLSQTAASLLQWEMEKVPG